MKYAVLIAAGALAAATPVSAAMDCGKAYKDFQQGLASSTLTGDQLAMVNRTALRGFDSCTAGDARFNTEAFWKDMATKGAAKDFASDFWQSQAGKGPAKN